MRSNVCRSGCPQRLWFYLIEHCYIIRRLIPQWDTPSARSPCELRLGTTPDISEAAQYQYVWYVNLKMEKKVARFIGVAKSIGSLMKFWVLPVPCHPLANRNISPISDDELATEEVRKLITELDTSIECKIADNIKDVNLNPKLELSNEIPIDLILDDNHETHDW